MTSRKFDTPDPDAFFQAAIQRRRAAKKARKRKKLEQNPTPSEPRPTGTPLWTPHGVDLNLVPPEVRQAIAELIQPVYEQYVLRATDALEKSLGNLLPTSSGSKSSINSISAASTSSSTPSWI